MHREEIARALQDKYENKNYYSLTDPKTPILINKYEKIADWHIVELENAKREARVEGLRFVLDNMYSVQNISKIKEEVSSQYITGQIKCMAGINKFIENEIINNKE